MARRPKTRVQRLVDAFEAAQSMQEALVGIDLRSVPIGPLRAAIKISRQLADDSVAALEDALKSDTPVIPRLPMPRVSVSCVS